MASFATDFADQAVVLPLFACVALTLWLIGRRRDALIWLATVGATLGLTLALKIATHDCGWIAEWLGAANPSGHTSSAAVVFGGVLALVLRRRTAAVVAAAMLAAVIGGTRLILGVHTPGDVLVGALVGIAGAVTLAALLRPASRPTAPNRLAVFLACAVVVAVFHGHRLAAESSIAELAAEVWPFSRCLAP